LKQAWSFLERKFHLFSAWFHWEIVLSVLTTLTTLSLKIGKGLNCIVLNVEQEENVEQRNKLRRKKLIKILDDWNGFC
jgi:hypothetical protein